MFRLKSKKTETIKILKNIDSAFEVSSNGNEISLRSTYGSKTLEAPETRARPVRTTPATFILETR